MADDKQAPGYNVDASNATPVTPFSVLATTINTTYSLMFNIDFYSSVPNPIADFENRITRFIAGLHDGYMFGLHNAQQGIFSTNLASALVTGISSTIWKYYNGFKAKDIEQQNKMIEWSEKNNFFQELKKGLHYSLALGTSCMKVDAFNHSITAYRREYFYFNYGYKSISNIKFVDPLFLGGIPGADNNIYYIVEQRFYKAIETLENIVTEEISLTKKAYVKYFVAKSGGNISTNQSYPVNEDKKINYEDLSMEVKIALPEYIRNNYDVDIELPDFMKDNLGCELLKYNAFDATSPMSPYGKSILRDILAYCVFWDFNRGFAITEQYSGKRHIYIPKDLMPNIPLNTPTNQGQEQGSLSQYPVNFGATNTGMDSFMNTLIDGGGKIEMVAFDLRADEIIKFRDDIIESIAMTLNLTPSTLASFLRNKGRVTATEIEYEESTTNNLMKVQLSVYTPIINKLISQISKLLGLDDCKIKHQEPGNPHKPLDVRDSLELFRENVIDIETLLTTIYPNKEMYELNTLKEHYEKEKRIKEAEEEKKKAENPDLEGSDELEENKSGTVIPAHIRRTPPHK